MSPTTKPTRSISWQGSISTRSSRALAGQVAFARSVLETKRDPKAAIAVLDWARLVAPGGLVEEAALRREIALLAEAQDTPRVALLTRQYATRFGASLYAAGFLPRSRPPDRAASASPTTLRTYQLLSAAAASLPPDGRRDFLLDLARRRSSMRPVRRGFGGGRRSPAGRGPDSVDETRGRLYLDAARLLSDGYDAARADLQAIAAAKFDRSDAGLLASVRSVAAQMRTAPSAGAIEAQGAEPSESAKAVGPAQTIGLAEAALKRTERAVDAGQGARHDRYRSGARACAGRPAFGHPAHGALSQAHDSLAFAAVLDAVPGGDAKPKPSSGEAQTPAESPRRDHPQAQQIANPSFFNAPLASSPTVATSTTIGNGKDDDVRTPELAAGATAPTPASDAAPPTRVANAAQGGSSIVARLVGERSFHASVAASSPATVAPVGGLSSVTDAPASATEDLDALAAPVSSASITTSNPPRPVASPPPVSPPTQSEPNPSRADRTLATASAPVQFSAGRARGERQTDVASTTSRGAAPSAETSAPGPGARRTSGSSQNLIPADLSALHRMADQIRLRLRQRRRRPPRSNR